MNKQRFTLKSSTGFTLLEVMLFLAISGVLTTIAIVGLGPRLTNVRFTQAVRGTEATINRQFQTSRSGENNRPDNFVCTKENLFGFYPKISAGSGVAGSSNECVINGTLVVFRETEMQFYSLVSLRESVGPEVTCSQKSFERIYECHKTRIARGTVGFTEPPSKIAVTYGNGVVAQSSVNNDGNVLAFGTLQDPNGTQRFQFFHTKGALAGASEQILSSTNTNTSVLRPYACLNLSGRSAKITFNVQSSVPAVTFEECTV